MIILLLACNCDGAKEETLYSVIHLICIVFLHKELQVEQTDRSCKLI